MNPSEIEFFSKCTSFELINEGFSDDIKWCVDRTYLLRISPSQGIEQLKNRAELTNAVHEVDERIPRVFEVGKLGEYTYTILQYIDGENGEIVLPTLNDSEQYSIGLQVGKMLQNMHRIPAPIDTPCWDRLWGDRFKKLVPKFEVIANECEKFHQVIPFINSEIHLLEGRPNAIYHFDFHPGNIIIKDYEFVGLIDMQKIRHGDPINEFYKMEYFNVPVSVHYARGVFDGYHNGKQIPNSFWALHRLYAAMHLVSAEVWGHEIAVDQLEKFRGYSLFTMDQFDDFNLLIPKWYLSSSFD